MKIPNWAKISWWAVLLVGTTLLLGFRIAEHTKGTATQSDLATLAVWVIIILYPLFSEIGFLGLSVKKEIESIAERLTQQFSNLATEVRSNVHVANVIQQTVQSSPGPLPEKSGEVLEKSPMRMKILRQLWTKQLTTGEDLSHVWGFRLNANASEFFDFRDAATMLMKDGLISETGEGQVFLTPRGFDYCKKHYKEFPPDQWWPEDKIDPERLKRVTGQT